MLEFNEEFFDRIIKLLQNPHPSATAEIDSLYEEVYAHYDAMGWIQEQPSAPSKPLVKAGTGGEPLSSGTSSLPSNSTAKVSKKLHPKVAQLSAPNKVSPKRSASSPSSSPSASPRPSSTDIKEAPAKKIKVDKSDKPEKPLKSVSSEEDLKPKKSDAPPLKPKEDKVKEEHVKGDAKSTALFTSDEEEPTSVISKRKKFILESSTDSDSSIGEGKLEKKKKSPPTIEDEGSTDADAVASVLGLTCVICKQLRFVPDNTLVECQDCHQLYHQKCHQPNISESQLHDPRVVWYCLTCTKKLKKAAISKSSNSGSNSTNKGGNSKDSSIQIKERQPSLFKRESVDSKASAAPAIPVVNKSSIRSMADDFLAKHKAGVTVSKKPPMMISSGSSIVSTSLSSKSASNMVKVTPATLGLPSSSGSAKPNFGQSFASSLMAGSKPTVSSNPPSTKFGAVKGSIKSGSAAGSTAQSKPKPAAANPPASISCTSMESADKRLQLMKKKAAAKFADKKHYR